MFAELMQKDFLEGKDKREALVAFLKDRHWSTDLAWDGEKHKSCPGKKTGTWRTTNFGFYQSADWQWRWFLGFRCTTCGCMVQFSQIAVADGDNENPVIRNVIVK